MNRKFTERVLEATEAVRDECTPFQIRELLKAVTYKPFMDLLYELGLNLNNEELGDLHTCLENWYPLREPNQVHNFRPWA